MADLAEFLKATREKYDLIFLDPPYETELLETAIAHIARHDLLNVHGMMIAEHPVDRCCRPSPRLTGWGGPTGTAKSPSPSTTGDGKGGMRIAVCSLGALTHYAGTYGYYPPGGVVL